jgi:hypothetical protein
MDHVLVHGHRNLDHGLTNLPHGLTNLDHGLTNLDHGSRKVDRGTRKADRWSRTLARGPEKLTAVRGKLTHGQIFLDRGSASSRPWFDQWSRFCELSVFDEFFEIFLSVFLKPHGLSFQNLEIFFGLC